MIKTVLLRPPELYGKDSFAQFYTLHESLGIGYLAACLREKNYPVKILDAHIEGLSIEETVEEIVEDGCDVIGVFIGSSLVMPQVQTIIQAVKRKKKQIHITLGGHFPTFCYAALFKKNKEVDTIVRFEGEETLPELVQALENNTPLADVQGIAFRKDSKIVVTPTRPLVADLDALPFPSRDSLPLLLKKGGLPLISGSRGCPARCSFCSVHAFYNEPSGKIWRPRSIENIIEEMKFLEQTYGCHELWFVDDNFLGHGRGGRQRVRKLFEVIEAEGLTINRLDFACRVDSLAKEPDILKMAYVNRTGLVYPGVEAGVQRILDIYNKGTTVAQNRQAVRAIQESNASLKMEFILFNPWITYDEIKESILFLEEVEAYDAYVLTSTLTIMRHTSLAASIEKGDLQVTPLPRDVLERQNLDQDSVIWYQLNDDRANALFQLVTTALPQLEYALSQVNAMEQDGRVNRQVYGLEQTKMNEEICLNLEKLIDETSLDIFKEAMDWVESCYTPGDQKHLTEFKEQLIEKTLAVTRSLALIIDMQKKEIQV